jgi:hypothetical protein
MDTYIFRPYQPHKYEVLSREEHPWSYSPIIIFGNDEELSGIYSDRIEQWDEKLTKTLYAKHMGKDFHGNYAFAKPEQIQAFLRERLNKPTLVLKTVVEWCNQSNGYPYWSFHFSV